MRYLQSLESSLFVTFLAFSQAFAQLFGCPDGLRNGRFNLDGCLPFPAESEISALGEDGSRMVKSKEDPVL